VLRHEINAKSELGLRRVVGGALLRPTDLDNFNKLSLDSLIGIAYLDDSQIVMLRIIRAYDKTNPGIELSLRHVNGPTAAGD
jgi:hypothetical protein